jgi:hypothetical protein
MHIAEQAVGKLQEEKHALEAALAASSEDAQEWRESYNAEAAQNKSRELLVQLLRMKIQRMREVIEYERSSNKSRQQELELKAWGLTELLNKVGIHLSCDSDSVARFVLWSLSFVVLFLIRFNDEAFRLESNNSVSNGL